MIDKTRLLNGLYWISNNIPDNTEAMSVLEELVSIVNRCETFCAQASLPPEFADSPAFRDDAIDPKKFLAVEVRDQLMRKLASDVANWKDIPAEDSYTHTPAIRAEIDVILPKVRTSTVNIPEIFSCLDAIEYGEEFMKDENS